MVQVVQRWWFRGDAEVLRRLQRCRGGGVAEVMVQQRSWCRCGAPEHVQRWCSAVEVYSRCRGAKAEV